MVIMDNMEETIETKYRSLYFQYSESLERLLKLIKDLLKAKHINYHIVQGRVKSVESFLQKASNYKNPFSEITDYIGLRIICYIPSDVEKVCDLIEHEFYIDKDNSINKTSSLGTDKVGYESIHYIAKLNKQRSSLTEFSFMKDFCFEIQIRTLLQHTWAEIEHDKNYKFSGTLPDTIKRRFNIISGTLELIDREFDSLSAEIDLYKIQVKQNLRDKKYDIEITTDSIIEYFEKKKMYDFLTNYSLSVLNKRSAEIIEEMHDFGLNTIQDFIDIEKKHLNQYLISKDGAKTIIGYIRHCMILEDANLYFTKAWKHHWTGIDFALNQFLQTKDISFEALLDMQ